MKTEKKENAMVAELPLGRLQAVGRAWAERVGPALAELLRCSVDARLTAIDRLAYGEFVASLESPTYFAVLKTDPFDDRMILQIEPSILFCILDRLLGGRGDSAASGRPPTDLELPLAARVARLLLIEVESAWASVAPLQVEVLQVESDPRRPRVLPSDEAVVEIAVELNVGDRLGIARLCIPLRGLARLLDDGRRQAPPHEGAAAMVDVAVTLAETSLSRGELRSLCPGDVIVTGAVVGEPAVVSIDGRPSFEADTGMCQGRKAVRLTRSIAGTRGDNLSGTDD